MTLVRVETILSRREFGTIFAGRVEDGGALSGRSIRVKASTNSLLGEPAPGESWSVEGEVEDSKWGQQIVATRAVRNLPSGRMMVDFLQSVAGIGSARAKRLWEAFEDRLPEVLESGDVEVIATVLDPSRPVLAPRLAMAAIAAWKEAAGQARLVEWLAAAGVQDLKVAKRVHALLGDAAPARLQANPYCLIPLARWPQADELGLRLLREAGDLLPERSPKRLLGAADAVVKDTVVSGSTAVHRDQFMFSMAKKLGAAPNSEIVVEAGLLAEQYGAVLAAEDGLFRAPGCALMEDAIASRLAELASYGVPEALMTALDGLAADPGTLHAEQLEAVQKCLRSGFACLRGGAGTGKTHVALAICRTWESAGGNLLLAAVAGKAALRLSRSTSRLARTAFRLLKELDEREEIERKLASSDLDRSEREALGKRLAQLARADDNTLVIIDESSMLDLPSTYGLLRRLPPGARVLMMGDEKQLPPVGFGLVFHRLVEEPNITAHLTTIHRQASGSGIPESAAMLRRREMPAFLPYSGPADGVAIIGASGRETIADRVVELHAQLGDETERPLIVTPVNEGPCGVLGLNRRLHDSYVARTGLKEMRGSLGEIYSPGEPLVHRRNAYKRGLFNGSMGKVLRIDPAAHSLIGVFDDEEHTFASEELIDLSLGYALTCHRAQGSEADRVIIALPQSRVLDPSWLYTAVTRARRQAVLVGELKTIQETIERPWAAEIRLTGMKRLAIGPDASSPV